MPRIKNLPSAEYRRSKTVWGAIYLVLICLAAGTAFIQLKPDPRIVRQSQKQYWANVAVSASRGDIEDKNGIPLAVSVPATSFFIDPKYWDPGSADLLVPVFGKTVAKKFSGMEAENPGGAGSDLICGRSGSLRSLYHPDRG